MKLSTICKSCFTTVVLIAGMAFSTVSHSGWNVIKVDMYEFDNGEGDVMIIDPVVNSCWKGSKSLPGFYQTEGRNHVICVIPTTNTFKVFVLNQGYIGEVKKSDFVVKKRDKYVP